MRVAGVTLLSRRACGNLVLVALLVLSGCGRETSERQSPSVQKVAVAVDAEQAPNAPKVTIDSSGRKWLTPEVPYDVFPDLPTAEEIAAGASNQPSPTENADGEMSVASASVGSTTPAPQSDETSSAAPASATSAPSNAGTEADWGDVLPLGVLQREIAAVRNRLGEALLTVGTYNSAFEEVANAGWEMSALATIVSEHPAEISWKDQALFARDAAVGVAMAATGRGRENFNTAQLASEQTFAIHNNNSPPGLAEPDPEASRGETADRAALMSRMQTAFDALKEAGADAASLKESGEEASHEAHVLAALAKFTANPDYTAADNEDYQSAAAKIIASGQAVADAAESGDHETFNAALARVNNACNQCHTKYRFAN